jgi:hypothetical protein
VCRARRGTSLRRLPAAAPLVIKIEATVDLSVSPPQVRVEPVAGDPWKDFGYWLEAVAVMAQYARDAQGWDNEQILDYTRDYLAKAVGDFDLRDR